MSVPNPTTDELLAAMRRSSLKTVVVEGDDDARIVRKLEELYGDPSVDFLPAGNRDQVCEIFKKRKAISHIKVAFLVDQDLWVFGSKPPDFDDLLTTEGYSIENDLLAGGQSVLQRLMDHPV